MPPLQILKKLGSFIILVTELLKQALDIHVEKILTKLTTEPCSGIPLTTYSPQKT